MPTREIGLYSSILCRFSTLRIKDIKESMVPLGQDPKQ